MSSMVLPMVLDMELPMSVGMVPGGFRLADLFSDGEQGALYTPWDLSTMYQDAAGTTPAAIDSPVGLLKDQSGNGNDASQSTDAARPILRGTAGGLRYLEFDGVDDALETGVIDPGATDVWFNCTALVMNYSTDEFLTWASYPGFVSDGFLLQKTGTSDHFRIGGSGTFDDGALIPNGDAVIASAKNEAAGSLSRLNQAQTDFGNTYNIAANKLGVGYRLDSDAQFLPGRIYGMVFCIKDLTDDEVDKTEKELAKRAGITL